MEKNEAVKKFDVLLKEIFALKDAKEKAKVLIALEDFVAYMAIDELKTRSK